MENIYPSVSPLIPGDVVLDFASGRISDEGNAVIEGVVVDDKFYSVSLDITEADALKVLNIALQDDIQLEDLNRQDVIRGMFAAFYEKKYKDSLAEKDRSISGLNDTIERLKESNSALSKELTELRNRLQEVPQEDPQESDPAVDYERIESIIENKLTRMEDAALDQLEDAVEKITSRLSELKSFNDTGQAATKSELAVLLEEEFNDAYAILNSGKQDLSADLDSLAVQISQISSRLSAIEDSIGKLSENAAEGFRLLDQKIDAIETAEIDETGIKSHITKEISRLLDINKSLTEKTENIGKEIIGLESFQGIIQNLRTRFSDTVVSGFSAGSSQIGTWKKEGDVLMQSDRNAYFAKYVLPVPQNSEPFLYSFEAVTEGNGWVGLGLHFFARSSDKKGYGFGESLLVWLTRDPDVYKSDRTWLELYRSNNDVDMYRVLHGGIEEPMDQYFKVEILYEPEAEYITIAVNGIDKIRYKTYFGVGNGIEVSLRSLGVSKFRNFSVKKRN
ncbi:MAG: hypothetical protein ACLFST_06775 [Spirochaetia bacterium]